MSESCPFCGKSFKRVKTHLPHCKLAPVTKATQGFKIAAAPPHKKGILSKKMASSLTSLPLVETANKIKKSSNKKPSGTSPLSELPPASVISSTTKKTGKPLQSSSTPCTVSSIPTSQKEKEELVNEIKSTPLSSLPSDPCTSFSPPLSHSTTPPITKTKKSLRAMIKATEAKPVSKIMKGIRATPPGLPLSPAPALAAVPLASTSPGLMGGRKHPVLTSSECELKATLNTGFTKPTLNPFPITVKPLPKDAAKKKRSQKEKARTAAETTTKHLSISQGPLQKVLKDRTLQAPGYEVTPSPDRIISSWKETDVGRTREDLFGTEIKEMEGLPWSKTKTTLLDHTNAGLCNTDSLPIQKSVLDHMKTLTTGQGTDHLFNITSTRQPIRDLSHNDQSLLVSVAKPVPPTPNAPLLARTGNGNITTMSSLPSTLSSSTGILNKTVFNNHVPTESVQISPPSPNLIMTVEAGRINQRLTKGMQPKIKTHHVAEQEALVGAVTKQTVMEVRLRNLPVWLADQIPNSPREGLEMIHRGWQRYYKRYIDVKKGGVGGVAMLLAGYCVLSYTWNYPHIKQDRWRKYH